MADSPRDSELTSRALNEADLDPDPVRQFQRWYDEALAAQPHFADAGALATVSPDGKPTCRMVLLKGIEQGSFLFFSNYESTKGEQLADNAWAALTFFWPSLERQVRIEGKAEPTTPAASDAYFRSRPYGSRIGAWASRQSEVLPDRATLERRYEELLAYHAGREVPRPPYWGGYLLTPTAIELWQGRPNRLHDRLRYRRDDRGAWQVERLSP